VLDLGCGRGEWLELLREKGLAAEGVDHNRVIVARCADLGLRVIEADLIEHLRGLSEASFGTVTAFHVIEHLPFSYLVDLIDEALRVLKPGGLMILETPNPANVQLACERFYFDPTHIRPLPSPLIRKLAEARGLCDIEILPLHPWPELSRVEEDGSELVRRFNALFYGPQDYAVIGRKRQSSTRAVALED
jgi:O-antigen chain-terminating methyltransferase